MNIAVILLVAVIGGAVLYLVARAVARGWLRARDTRVVRCPASHEPAAVELDRWRALRANSLEVRSCSDWPERAGCEQTCLQEIEEAPDGCRVRSLLSDWYRGQRCALCSQPFEEIQWMDRPPGFLDSAGATGLWAEHRAEQLPELLQTYRPVCADCHLADRFRREHGDLVVERPGRDPVQRVP